MLLGEDESPLPSMLGTMMKYCLGSRAWSSPMVHSTSVWWPEYQVGWMMTLSFLALSVPKVL